MAPPKTYLTKPNKHRNKQAFRQQTLFQSSYVQKILKQKVRQQKLIEVPKQTKKQTKKKMFYFKSV